MDIISTFKDKRIQIINKKNEGVSTARNLGIKNAKGDFIAFLDADDIWYPTHLEDLKNLIAHFPNCGLYCTAYETYYYDKKRVKAKFSGIDHPFFGIVPDYFESSLIDCIAWTSAVAIPKIILEKHGDFNPRLKSGEDTELWIRIALKEEVAFVSSISAQKVVSDSKNHLSQSKKSLYEINILNQFGAEESININFKKYMDLNRFSMAIQLKMNGDIKDIKNEILPYESANFNAKQNIILKMPGVLLRLLKHFQIFLLKNNVYISPYR
jgi:glycosyltransferase involved in cell wall biosynthesis